MNSGVADGHLQIEFPDLEMIRFWYGMLIRNDILQKAFYLPLIDDEWYREMLSAFETTALHPDCRTNIEHATARICYKITKNHYRVDGNKRSAVMCTFLFLMLNGCWLSITPRELRRFLKGVAKSPAEQSEREIQRITSRLGSLIVPF